MRPRIIIGTQKGTIILTVPHIALRVYRDDYIGRLRCFKGLGFGGNNLQQKKMQQQVDGNW